MALYFDLDSFGRTGHGATADSELLRLVNRRVASYYLAVPLAGEDNRVTVATAYPDNAAALWMLQQLLHADVVPVSSSEDELQEVIARVYPAPTPPGGPILVWAADPAWTDSTAAAATVFANAHANGIHANGIHANGIHASGIHAPQPIVILDASATLDEALDRAAYDFSLLVARVPDDESAARLVSRSPVSLLLLRDEFTPIDHVLVALRGYGSDHETLDRVLPFLAQGGATATVLPLAHSAATRLNDLLADDSPARRHLRAFLRDLDRTPVQVDVRLCQGDPVSQIANEMAQGRYAMLVLAAEGEGHFVRQVLSRLEHDGLWDRRPVLIIKPPVRLSEPNPDLTGGRS